MSRVKSDTAVRRLPRSDGFASPKTCLGCIVGADTRGPTVDYPGNPHGPLPALTLVRFSGSTLRELVKHRTPVMLAFERERSDKPVILGVVQDAPFNADDDAVAASAPASEKHPARTIVDQKEIVVRAHERLELRCGKASVILTAAGKVLVRGQHVSTRSAGANRIRGGSVELN